MKGGSVRNFALNCSAIFVFLILITFKASAIPALPKTVILKQSDGTKFKARMWGDEWNHGFETLDGYTILFNETSKNWEYAVLDSNGKLKCSGKVVTKDPPQGIPKRIRPKLEGAKSTILTSPTLPQKAVPSKGEVNVPVVLIKFPDLPAKYSSEDFGDLLFNDSKKSLRTYYKEVSYGKLLLSGDVSGWYVAKYGHDYYGSNQGFVKAAELVKEAVQQADLEIDFSKYDNDGDGYVDVVMVVHSGAGAETSGNLTDVWSHQWYLSSAGVGEYVTNDGVIIDRYTIQPEIDDQLITIGVFAHEFGHALGLPDLYDRDGSSCGVGYWDVMGYGSWLGILKSGDTPSHFSAWSKWYLGWIKPIQVKGWLINQSIGEVETSGEVYQLLSNPNGPNDWNFKYGGVGEYFLIENRRKIGFDSALPGEGLLIWHIDESVLNNTNENHKLVDLEEADGRNDLDYSNNCGDETDPWYDNSMGFTDVSNPNSDFYNGTKSGVYVVNIGAANSVMTADIIIKSSKDERIKLEGNAKILWNVTIPNVLSAYTFGDFDGDKLPDILVASKSFDGVKITALSGKDGRFLWNTDFTGYDQVSVKSVGDLNKDGIGDFVASLLKIDNSTKIGLAALSGKGDLLWAEFKEIYKGWVEAYKIDGVAENYLAVVWYNVSCSKSTCNVLSEVSLADGLTGKTLWRKNYTDWTLITPSNDLNSDNTGDIVAVNTVHKYIEAINGVNGTILWKTQGYRATLTEDLDGDKLADVIITNESHTIALRGSDGKEIWNVTGFQGGIFNVNDDNISDVLIYSYTQGKVRVAAINGINGSEIWSKSLGNANWTNIVITGDLSGDGKRDLIVIIYQLWRDEKLDWYHNVTAIAIDCYGKILWNRTWHALSSGFVRVFSVVDLDNDSRDDIVLFAWSESTDAGWNIEISAIKGNNGQVFWSIQRSANTLSDYSAKPIGDFNGDGRMDVSFVKSQLLWPQPNTDQMNIQQSDILAISSAKTFTGNKIEDIIWSLNATKPVKLVEIARPETRGVDFNGDNLSDSAMIVGNCRIYVVVSNKTITGNQAVVILPNITVMFWEGNYTIPLLIANAKNITGLDVNISFDSTIVKIVNVKINTSFYNNSNISFTIKNNSVRVALTNTEGITSMNPAGLIDVVFKTRSVGKTHLNVTYAELSDENFKPVKPKSIVNGSIRVTIKGDFNFNGKVDIGDVSKVAHMVVEKIPKDPRADFNANGKIDVGDVAKIAYYLIGKIEIL